MHAYVTITVMSPEFMHVVKMVRSTAILVWILFVLACMHAIIVELPPSLYVQMYLVFGLRDYHDKQRTFAALGLCKT